MLVYEAVVSVGAAVPSNLSVVIFKVSTTRFVVMERVLSWRETAELELTVYSRRFIR